MASSADEHSALKRNTVHQTRLSLELQQLEKDRSIRLREMEKASQVFARRQEQIHFIRDKACLRRATSAPPAKQTSRKLPLVGTLSFEGSINEESPFVTKTYTKLGGERGERCESPKRRIHRTMTSPNMVPVTSSQYSSSSSVTSTRQRSANCSLKKEIGFEKTLHENSAKTTRLPSYSRNFSGHRQRGEPNLKGLTGKPFHDFSLERDRRDSLP